MTFAEDVETLADAIAREARALADDIITVRKGFPPDSEGQKMCVRLQVAMLGLNMDCGTLKATLRAAITTRQLLQRGEVEGAVEDGDRKRLAGNDKGD